MFSDDYRRVSVCEVSYWTHGKIAFWIHCTSMVVERLHKGSFEF